MLQLLVPSTRNSQPFAMYLRHTGVVAFPNHHQKSKALKVNAECLAFALQNRSQEELLGLLGALKIPNRYPKKQGTQSECRVPWFDTCKIRRKRFCSFLGPFLEFSPWMYFGGTQNHGSDPGHKIPKHCHERSRTSCQGFFYLGICVRDRSTLAEPAA